MLLGEGIFAGQGAEAQRGNQSGGFGLREEAAEVSEARAGQPGERAVFGEEIAGQGGIGGVQQRAQSIYFGEGVRTKIRQSAHRTGVQRDRVVDRLADRKVTLLVRFCATGDGIRRDAESFRHPFGAPRRRCPRQRQSSTPTATRWSSPAHATGVAGSNPRRRSVPVRAPCRSCSS